MNTPDFSQPPCAVKAAIQDHDYWHAARDNLHDMCLRQAERELDNAATQDEIDDRAAELMREME